MAGMYMVNRIEADLTAPGEILGIEVILSGAQGKFWLDTPMVATALTGATELSDQVVGAVRDLIAGRTSEHIVRCYIGLPSGVLEPTVEVGSFATALQGCMVEPGSEEYEQVMAAARERNRDSAWRSTFHAGAAADFRNFCNGLITEADELRPALRALGLEFEDDEILRMTVNELELENRPWREVMGALFALIVSHEASCHSSTYAVDVVDQAGDGGLPIAAMREFLDSRVLCLTPSGTIDRPGFNVRPAARLSGDTPAITALLSRTRAELTKFLHVAKPAATTPPARHSVCTMVSEEWDPSWPAMVAGTGLLADPADVPWMPEAGGVTLSPCVVADTFLHTRITGTLPGWPTLVDLDEPLDVTKWIRRRMEEVSGIRGLWPVRTEDVEQISENIAPHYGWAVDKRDFRVVTTLPEEQARDDVTGQSEPSAVDKVSDIVTLCGYLVGRMGVELNGLRLRADDEVRHHSDQPSVWIEALDGGTGQWLLFGDLSPHRARMVAGALAIVAAMNRNPAEPVFITGSDLDWGLGSDGSVALLRTLTELGCRSVVAMPAAVAQRVPQAREVRLVHDDLGVGVMADQSPGGSLREVAARLGVEPIDALSVKSVVAGVPTERDRLALEVVLHADAAFDRVLVETLSTAVWIAGLRSDLVYVELGGVVELLDLAGDEDGDLDGEDLRAAVQSLDAFPDSLVNLLTELTVTVDLAALQRGLSAGMSQPDVTVVGKGRKAD